MAYKNRYAPDDELDDLVNTRMQAQERKPLPQAPRRQNFGLPEPQRPKPELPREPSPPPPVKQGNSVRDLLPPAPPPAPTGLRKPPTETGGSYLSGMGPGVTKNLGGLQRPDFVPTADDVQSRLDALDGLDDGSGAGAASTDTRDPEVIARDQEMQSEAAKNQAAASARAGLGGFGLSGGSAAMLADIGSADARNRIEALAQLERDLKDENFQDVQRTAAINDLEDADDTDYDGDGFIGGKPVGGVIGDRDPDNNPLGKGEKDPEAIAPEGGGKAKRIEDMTDEEFNKLSKEQAEAAGWRAERWVDDQGNPSSAMFATHVVWIGPDGEERVVPIDDFAERTSAGLEWKD